MNIEKAIKTAIEYEENVFKVYDDAKKASKDEDGKRIFGLLAKEEGYHISYLKKRLKECEDNGTITVVELKSTVPSVAEIADGIKKLEGELSEKDYNDEILMLRKALEVEIKTYNFYKDLVAKLDGDGKKLFSNFLEIEKNHQELVQAEIDQLEGNGFWFDFPEFDLEVE